MTTIEKYLKQFEAYFNGNLDPSKKLAFEELIRQNNEVHAAWTEYCSLMEACSDHEAISLRSLLEKAYSTQYADNSPSYILINQWAKLAAAALIIILVGSLVYFFFPGGGETFPQKEMVILIDSTSSQDIADTIPKLAQEEKESASSSQDPDNPTGPIEVASIFDQEEYQISPVFAELLHNVYRSNWFRVILPEDSTLLRKGESIAFSWETNIKEPIFFDVLDRNGNVVYEEPEPISSPWKYTPNLSPAIYMYRFSTKDQPVWMGVVVSTH